MSVGAAASIPLRIALIRSACVPPSDNVASDCTSRLRVMSSPGNVSAATWNPARRNARGKRPASRANPSTTAAIPSALECSIGVCLERKRIDKERQ